MADSHIQDPLFDALYCHEEDRFLGDGLAPEDPDSGHDLTWDDGELSRLLSEEKTQHAPSIHAAVNSDGGLRIARDEAIQWVLRVTRFHGFRPLTAVLAANYFDRFLTTPCFRKEKPWMAQLTAVACISIAAKVEETRVPLLLDLQVEGCKYIFEAKTIQRMELLVLSTLGWRMNPVTPIAYFDHFCRRFGSLKKLHSGFLSSCENVILSIVADCSLIHYHPSVIAGATMLHVIREMEPLDSLDYQNQIIISLGEKIFTCEKFIDHHRSFHKRKRSSIPSSPSGVIDTFFGSESSVDSWAIGLSVSSSPEPLMKRTRARDQHMRLGTVGTSKSYN